MADDLYAPHPEWMQRALCAQTDPEAFFPEKGGSTREAKKVCLRCDVRADCLTYAMENNERFGIWGGLSERERRRRGMKSATQLAREAKADAQAALDAYLEQSDDTPKAGAA